MRNFFINSNTIKECFNDYNFSKDDISSMACSADFKIKEFIFEKILANSTNIVKNLKIFSKVDLKILIQNYKVPAFNHDFLQKRKDIISYIFFDAKVDIEELRWI